MSSDATSKRKDSVSAPSSPRLRLNLGAGQNPMGDGRTHPGFTINADIDPRMAEKDLRQSHGDYVLFSPGHLPFRQNVFDEVHAVNPYGFNPVSHDTTSMLTPGGSLLVSGNMKNNKYAKNSGQTAVEPQSVGLTRVNEGAGIPPAHHFGTQTLTAGREALKTDFHGWAQYQKPAPQSFPSISASTSAGTTPPSSSGYLGGRNSAFAKNLQKAFQKKSGLF